MQTCDVRGGDGPRGSELGVVEENPRKLARGKAETKVAVHCTCKWLKIQRWVDRISKNRVAVWWQSRWHDDDN